MADDNNEENHLPFDESFYNDVQQEKPFEPIFMVDDKKVRVERVTITQGKLILHLVPA